MTFIKGLNTSLQNNKGQHFKLFRKISQYFSKIQKTFN